ncbi:MAG TPA: subclass B3 metallo-beta-lactamase [Mucilaginibacter sp.]|jgi:metallo-beta-lactamase class B|nr:subclass B3 metallo-beta-lactamase [Mucilaginibacter sp.]
MPALKRSLQLTLFIVSLSFIAFISTAQKLIPLPLLQPDWSRDYQPFRICGNLYYVGTYDLACYLITTPKGHILVNTGLPGSAPMIRSHVEALGFSFSDIKILLATHAHFDHVGAMAEVKKITGAKLMINEYDAPLLVDGGNSDYVFGGKGSTFQPVKADRLLHADDTVKLGGMQVITLHHPGHTKGACSFLFDVNDGRRSYRVLIANMPSILDGVKPGMPAYPDVAKDYAYTLNAMKNLRFDIWLASHASQFGMHQKHKPGDGYHPEVFIDRQGYNDALGSLQKAYFEKLNNR